MQPGKMQPGKKQSGNIMTWTLLTLVTCCGSGRAEANLVKYSDVFGSAVTFSGICETSTETGPFYGQPVAMGDAVVSPGVGFLTQSVNGQIGMVNGRLQMTLTADPGFLIDGVSINQSGSWLGFGNAANLIASTHAMLATDQGTFTGSALFSAAGNGGGIREEGLSIGIPATGRAVFSLDHQLLSSADSGGAAFVDTSSIRISVSTMAASVPEPQVALLLSGIAAGTGICRMRRRRN